MNPRREALIFLAFAAPNLILFAVFNWWPVLYNTYVSLTDWRLPADHGAFVGIANYRTLLSDTEFWRVVANTFIYAGAVVIIAQTAAFVLALLLNRDMPGSRIFGAITFAPYITTTAAAAIVWVLLLDPKIGPLSAVYSALNVEGPYWLRDNRLALWAIVIVGAWKEIGIATLFFLAGMRNLPCDCYDAAAIEGAGSWNRVTRLTLPLMGPVILFLAVSGFVAAVKVFDAVAIMSEGGPSYPASSTFVYHLYVTAFRDYRFGEGAALSMVFLVFMTAFAYGQFRLGRRWVHYGD